MIANISERSGGKPLFVSGATGRHGGTGHVIIRELLKKGARVRALARVDDERPASLRAAGADVVIGDLHDYRTLRSSLEGVEAAYFTYPMKFGSVDAAANFAAAARAARVPRIVIMSAISAGPEHPSPLARSKWLADQVIEWAGLPYLSLRVAGWFYENLALLHPERFGQDRVVYPTFTELLSFPQIAKIVGERMGKPVRHETIPPKEWQERLIRLSASDDRIDALMAEHLAVNMVVFSQVRRAPQVNLLGFETLTGEKPMTLASAIATGKLSFEQQSSSPA
jgi:hypothetical protein